MSKFWGRFPWLKPEWGLSTANYNALLIGWETQEVKDNVTINAGSSQYSLGALQP